jgi:hypothetical protein
MGLHTGRSIGRRVDDVKVDQFRRTCLSPDTIASNRSASDEVPQLPKRAIRPLSCGSITAHYSVSANQLHSCNDQHAPRALIIIGTAN